MQRILGLTLAALICLALAACERSRPAGPAFQKLGLKEALAEAAKQKKIVMVDFGATWCGPCRQMEDTTFSDPQVQQFLSEHTIAIQVDIDKQQALMQKFGVSGVPTMVFLDADGNELDRLVGYKDAGQFLRAATQLKK